MKEIHGLKDAILKCSLLNSNWSFEFWLASKKSKHFVLISRLIWKFYHTNKRKKHNSPNKFYWIWTLNAEVKVLWILCEDTFCPLCHLGVKRHWSICTYRLYPPNTKDILITILDMTLDHRHCTLHAFFPTFILHSLSACRDFVLKRKSFLLLWICEPSKISLSTEINYSQITLMYW